jgi:hypothetical protein
VTRFAVSELVAVLPRLEAYLALNHDQESQVLYDALRQLHLNLRSSRDDFHDPVELRLLGQSQISIAGHCLDLRLRFAELLAVLSLYPQGCSCQELTLAVYGEVGKVTCCKTELYRLRELLPVGSRPYRLELEVWADFLELPKLLKEGRVLEAIALYRGPLLPFSESPTIIELRESLEEALRQAALASDDPEALWALTGLLHQDCELWEKLLTLLPRHDPRHPLTRAMVNQIHAVWLSENERTVVR